LKRAKKVIGEANLVLWVTAADEPLAQNEKSELISISGKRTICIINKSDQTIGREKTEYFEKKQRTTISVSLTHNKNVNELIQMIEKEICVISDSIELPEVLLNRRHEEIGRKIKREINQAAAEWQRPEIAAVHLKNGLSALDEITGATNSEEVLNRVFEQFCIGK
jgi:tRNA modification GTPase